MAHDGSPKGRTQGEERRIARRIGDARATIAEARRVGKSVGFVPTMGDLHAGHVSLIRRARAECGFVVLSIYVNPLQFGPREDFESYPRRLEEDVAVAAREKVDLVFAPADEDMYPEGFATFVLPERGTDRLCGRSRPGHFRGVLTVVAKLLNVVQPDRAYFGQKDAQQVVLVKQMVRDLNFHTEIVACPTVREADGLAISSRNRYLSETERREASSLCRALGLAEKMVAGGEKRADVVVNAMREVIAKAPAARVDYVAIVDPETLEDVETITKAALAAVAAWFGKARLIDNTTLNPRG